VGRARAAATQALAECCDECRDLLRAQRVRSTKQQGELRASAGERDALARFEEMHESITDGMREQWLELRGSIDSRTALCRCGHPASHHDEWGSCFHVIGCATGCGCQSCEPVA